MLVFCPTLWRVQKLVLEASKERRIGLICFLWGKSPSCWSPASPVSMQYPQGMRLLSAWRPDTRRGVEKGWTADPPLIRPPSSANWYDITTSFPFSWNYQNWDFLHVCPLTMQCSGQEAAWFVPSVCPLLFHSRSILPSPVPLFLSFCPSVFSFFLSFCLPVCLSVCLSVSFSLSLSVCVSISHLSRSLWPILFSLDLSCLQSVSHYESKSEVTVQLLWSWEKIMGMEHASRQVLNILKGGEGLGRRKWKLIWKKSVSEILSTNAMLSLCPKQTCCILRWQEGGGGDE